MDTAVIYCTSCGTSNAPGARFCYKCGAQIMTAETPASPAPPSDFITLSCPSCGGNLDITPDMERFACKFCGSEHMVRRSAGMVSLAPVVESLKRVETKFDQVLTGSDRMAAEQTIQRLKKEIPELEQQAAEKEAYLKSIKKPSSTLGKRMVSGGCVSLPLLFLGFGLLTRTNMDSGFMDTQTVAYYYLGLSALMVLIILIGWININAANSKTRVADYEAKIAQARTILEKAQADLRERKEQLANLQRYTAQR